jgi:hypothetical protein
MRRSYHAHVVRLFSRTYARRIREQEQIYLNKLNIRYSRVIAMHSQPTIDNAQLMIFTHRIDSALRVYEELNILCSLKYIETGDGTNVCS